MKDAHKNVDARGMSYDEFQPRVLRARELLARIRDRPRMHAASVEELLALVTGIVLTVDLSFEPSPFYHENLKRRMAQRTQSFDQWAQAVVDDVLECPLLKVDEEGKYAGWEPVSGPDE
jgi:hypothetical protein